MTGDEFLDRVAERKMVPQAMIDKLRRQVRESSRPVSAARVAKAYVDAGHITEFQARQLIVGDEIEAKPPNRGGTEPTLPPPDDDDLDLAPLDDDEKEKPTSKAKSPSHSISEVKDVLSPGDHPAPATPPLGDPLDELVSSGPPAGSAPVLISKKQKVAGLSLFNWATIFILILAVLLFLLLRE